MEDFVTGIYGNLKLSKPILSSNRYTDWNLAICQVSPSPGLPALSSGFVSVSWEDICKESHESRQNMILNIASYFTNLILPSPMTEWDPLKIWLEDSQQHLSQQISTPKPHSPNIRHPWESWPPVIDCGSRPNILMMKNETRWPVQDVSLETEQTVSDIYIYIYICFSDIYIYMFP